MHLVIVESPTKARKLAEYLGSEFTIEASVGHVADLPKKKLGVDIENNFEPTYEISEDKEKVVKRLRELASKADRIYLATDPDREGEAIAWHIQELLKASHKGKTALTNDHFLRSTFHEITKSAVKEAIDHPSTLRMDLVDAQQARRVVDRLVGYQVSPVLWKKVRRGLSAGRVQSVALRLIVDREREIEAFKAEEYWEVDVALTAEVAAHKDLKIFVDGKPLEELPTGVLIARVVEVDGKKYEPHQVSEVTGVTEDLGQATYTVEDVERKTRERSSLPPFTTSTLQQSAATRLGFTSKQTMALAQQLYEEGLITYHRTDSVNLSTQSVSMARDFIKAEFGVRYLPEKPRFFAQKSKNAQEAHEAIRVTDTSLPAAAIIRGKISERHQRLYDLIWRRFLASQMSSAVYDQTAIMITAVPTSMAATSTSAAKSYGLRSSGSVLTFDGWMKLFTAQGDTLLPAVNKGQELPYLDQNAAQKFTQPPARYNDASLVKELEKRGIGRPSTYASIISVIVDRGYVDRQDKRFMATATGLTVSDFLVKYFITFMDYDFTAEMEEDLDRISRGEKAWRTVVKDFYTPLDKTIQEVTKDAERVQVPVEETGENCPLCFATDSGMIVIRTGRFGKFKSCNRFPECKFTENIVEKVEGMKCPLCQEGDVIVKNSRWGKSFFGCSRYPGCDWASWSKPELNYQLSPAEWEMMKQQREERKKAREASRGGAQRGAKSATGGSTKPPKSKTKIKRAAKAKISTKSKTSAKSKAKSKSKTPTTTAGRRSAAKAKKA